MNKDKLKEYKDILSRSTPDSILKTILESKIGPRGLKGDSIKGDKGDQGDSIKGDKGDTPKVGIDFIQPKDGISIKGEPGNDVDESSVIKEIFKMIRVPKDGKSIKGTPGKPGKDADEKKIAINIDTGIEKAFTKKEEEFIKKLSESFHPKLIEMVQKLQVHGGGLGREEIIALITGTASTGGRTDLSSQCDGANLVFTLDDNYVSGSVIIWTGSFPIVYRSGIDFTETGLNEITLVIAQVPAPKTGQTLVATYDKS